MKDNPFVVTKMKTDYEIVTYQPDFRKHVVELQKKLWSPDWS